MNFRVFVLTLLCRLGETLIGLRPPSADPIFRKHQLQRSRHYVTSHRPEQYRNETQKSIAKFVMQRSYKNFVLKKDVLDSLKKITANDMRIDNRDRNNKTSIHTGHQNCNHYTPLKCSIRFLKASIRNEIDCENFGDLSRCLCPFCTSNECSIRNSLIMVAHESTCNINQQNHSDLSKGTDHCCEDDLLKCTIDAYLSLIENDRGCETISEFTICISDLSSKLKNEEYDRIFHLLLSLTKSCIFSLKTSL